MVKHEHIDNGCTDEDGSPLNIGVVRDTWRSFLIEREYKHQTIYLVNQCLDKLRYADDDNLTNKDCNLNSIHFSRYAKHSIKKHHMILKQHYIVYVELYRKILVYTLMYR